MLVEVTERAMAHVGSKELLIVCGMELKVSAPLPISKDIRPVSPTAMCSLGLCSDGQRWFRHEHVSGSGRGEPCIISVYFGTKLGL